MKEYFDVFDENRQPLGKVYERSAKLFEGEYGICAEVWILNTDGKLLISRRHYAKSHGGEWDVPGGVVQAGETSRNGAIREVKEEIGVDISNDSIEFIGTAKHDYFFVDVYCMKRDIELKDLVFQPTEVIDARWVSTFDFERMCISGEIKERVIERYSLFGNKILI